MTLNGEYTNTNIKIKPNILHLLISYYKPMYDHNSYKPHRQTAYCQIRYKTLNLFHNFILLFQRYRQNDFF